MSDLAGNPEDRFSPVAAHMGHKQTVQLQMGLQNG